MYTLKKAVYIQRRLYFKQKIMNLILQVGTET